jgi:hypothetical protein
LLYLSERRQAPVAASRVLRESAAESRFEALRATATPLVGRDEELAMLERRWQQAKTGEGGVVLLSGEPGIGKSRLAQTLLERLSGEPHTRLRTFCSPHHQDQALYPTIAQLELAARQGATASGMSAFRHPAQPVDLERNPANNKNARRAESPMHWEITADRISNALGWRKLGPIHWEPMPDLSDVAIAPAVPNAPAPFQWH